jgi:hypothetical protein
MDDTTSTTASGVTSGTAALPLPQAGPATPSTVSTGAHNDAGYTSFGDAAARAAVPVADDLVERARQGAHETVDKVAATVASAAQCVQSGASKVGEAPVAWVDSARDVIRSHPLAAVGGALLIGVAMSSLASMRDQ